MTASIIGALPFTRPPGRTILERWSGLATRAAPLHKVDQFLQFGTTQRTKRPFFQLPESQRSEGDSLEMHHLVPDAGEQTTDFAVLAFSHHHFDQRAQPLLFDDPQITHAELPFCEEEALPQLFECAWFGFACDHCSVNTLDLKLGMGEPVGQFAIVGDEDQTLGVLIEPTDCEQPGFARRDQIDHTTTACGIGRRAEEADRLVNEIIDLLREFQFLAIDRDLLGLRINLRPECGNDTIHCDPSGRDQLLTGPA